MPPKIVLKRGLNRVPTGGKSIKAPKKGPMKAPKSSKQRRASSSSSSSLSSSASLNLSDDEGYSAVEDVSDSDDDEENVFAAEEEHILANAERPAAQSSPRPTSSDIDGGDDEAAADADDDDDNEHGHGLELESTDGTGDGTSSASWNGFASDNNDEPAPVQGHSAEPISTTPVERHVRFAGVPDSESDSDETDEDIDDFFPDIFIAQDSLDSGFRREIEQDDDDDSSISVTYWDYQGASGAPEDSDYDPYGIDEEFPNIFGGSSVHEPNDSTQSKVPELPLPEDDDDESDGYMSDGETTEEDEPEPVPRKKLIPILRAVPGEPSDSEKSEGGTPRPIKKSIKKPIVVMNPITRKMMVITPQKKKRRFDVILDPVQFQPDYFSYPNSHQTSSIMGNPGSLMMSAMSSANFFAGGVMDFSTVGPAEAFFPLGVEPYMRDDSEDSWLVDAEQEEDVEERNLNIEDFLDFGDGGSEAEDEVDKSEDGNTDATPSRRSSMAPSALSDSNTDVHPLLSHLTNNADAVGAFRRNQVNQQLILNGQATQESLAFSNPLYHGTLRGIKHGSLGGAATPLTPERRHKKIMAKSPSEAVMPKRKASGPASDISQAHKRQRSISDVRKMHL